jgi:leucyl aminopeptidase (aminopeptidase T)
MEEFGKRPLKMPKSIFEKLKDADASIYCAGYVLGELDIFRQKIYDLVYSTNRLRHAGMGGIEKRLIEDGMNVDYKLVKEYSNKIFNLVKNCRTIEVTTSKGTNLTAEFGKYKWIKCEGYPKPGLWTNLPDGEIFTSPTRINGKVVIDGVLGDCLDEKYGCIEKTPIISEIKEGRAISLSCKNKNIEKDMAKYFKIDKNASRIGEFAIGTNIGLKKIVGNLLQDEKFPGVHIAFGDSYPDETGAEWGSKSHVDGVILKANIVVDGRIIMKEGKFTSDII